MCVCNTPMMVYAAAQVFFWEDPAGWFLLVLTSAPLSHESTVMGSTNLGDAQSGAGVGIGHREGKPGSTIDPIEEQGVHCCVCLVQASGWTHCRRLTDLVNMNRMYPPSLCTAERRLLASDMLCLV